MRGADGPGLRALAPAGQVELIDSDGEVAPGVHSLHTPGHTPGPSDLCRLLRRRTALFLGDAVACPVQMESPELEALADMDKSLGIQTRDRILKEIAASDLVSGPHLPDVRFGRMVVGEGKRLWS